MKVYYKSFLFLLAVVLFFINSAPLYLYGKLAPYHSRFFLSRVCQLYARVALRILGIRYKSNSRVFKNNNLIVANHLSYIDIFLMAAIRPTCFVTSIEIKKTPFLGQICDFAGCLYVERRSRENLDYEIKDISNALKSGLNVTIFPEATSTNGDVLKRFKRPLFKAAINSDINVTPVSINYKKINTSYVCVDNRDSLFWYGDMTFGPHIWNLMKLDSIEAEVVFGDDLFNTCETELSLIAHSHVKKNLEVYS